MFSRRPSLSQVLHTLDRLSIVENTFVVATSDNGQLTMLLEPFGSRSNGPYRHGKFSAWEGGHRVFGLLRWPGRIVPGVSNRLTSHLDLLPTFAALVGAALPERPLDGEDMGPWLFRRANSTSAASATRAGNTTACSMFMRVRSRSFPQLVLASTRSGITQKIMRPKTSSTIPMPTLAKPVLQSSPLGSRSTFYPVQIVTLPG